MLTCKSCGLTKDPSLFYASNLARCKECVKESARQNREEKKEYYMEYDRNRPNKAERNEITKERIKSRRLVDEEFRLTVNQNKQDWAQRNPHKRKAQNALSNAVRDGDVLKLEFCEHCFSSDKKIEGHHWSYLEEHWLDVIWLCTKCHGLEHKRLNTLDRDPDKL